MTLHAVIANRLEKGVIEHFMVKPGTSTLITGDVEARGAESLEAKFVRVVKKCEDGEIQDGRGRDRMMREPSATLDSN